MEGEVARPFARGDARRLRLVRREQALLDVELVDEDVVRAEVGDVGAAVLRMEVDAVGMRAGLAASVRTRANVLDRRARRGEGTVFLDRQGGGRTGTVVHDDEILARGVDGEVRRALALGGFGIQQAQLVAFDGVSSDGAFGGLSGGVEELRVGAEREIGSGLRFGGDGRRGDFTGLAIEHAAEHTLGLGAGGTDIEDILGGRRLRRGLGGGLRRRRGGVGALAADEDDREGGEDETWGVHDDKIGGFLSGHSTSRQAGPSGASRRPGGRRRGRGVRPDRL